MHRKKRVKKIISMIKESNVEKDRDDIREVWASYEILVLILILSLIEVYFLSIIIDQLMGN